MEENDCGSNGEDNRKEQKAEVLGKKNASNQKKERINYPKPCRFYRFNKEIKNQRSVTEIHTP